MCCGTPFCLLFPYHSRRFLVSNFQAELLQSSIAEDFVRAQQGSESKIIFRYVIRNAMMRRSQLGAVSWADLEQLLRVNHCPSLKPPLLGHHNGDYMIMGIISLSIVAITTLVLIVDLMYPSLTLGSDTSDVRKEMNMSIGVH